MKKTIITAIVLSLGILPAGLAQVKVGHVSTDAIMKQLPDAQDAQKQIDALVVEWQTEVNKMQQDWQRKFDDYEKRKLILTDQRRAEFERGVRELDQKMVDFRTRKFGQNGELFARLTDMMKPVQDHVLKARQDAGLVESNDYVFDKS